MNATTQVILQEVTAVTFAVVFFAQTVVANVAAATLFLVADEVRL